MLDISDGVTLAVSLILFVMSVATWVLIFWKTYRFTYLRQYLLRAQAAFWQASTIEIGIEQVKSYDALKVLTPLLSALAPPAPNTTVLANTSQSAQRIHHLRGALEHVLSTWRSGQMVLATVGSTAPFVGLLGTVWGVYHALSSIHREGNAALDVIAGPIGSALIMTAAGLAVAIPAVLAYNVFGRALAKLEAQLEGFAHDLLEIT